MRLTVPAFVWTLALAAVYLCLGFMVGYFLGYMDGVEECQSMIEEIVPN
jgi:ABC-type dipeptide/oligopeptide/nickel transport system permease component